MLNYLPTYWKETFRQFTRFPLRSLVTIFTLTIGLSSIGVLFITYDRINQDLNNAYRNSNPAHINIYSNFFERDYAKRLERIEGIADLTIFHDLPFQLTETNQNIPYLTISVYPLLEDVNVHKFDLESGRWPSRGDEIVLERTSLTHLNVEVGDTIALKASSGKSLSVKIVGSVHDLNAPPPEFSQILTGYANSTILSEAGIPTYFSQINILLDNSATEKLNDTSTEIIRRLERGGIRTISISHPNTNSHPAAEPVNTMLFLLVAAGVFAIIISIFMIISIIKTVLMQHTRQIGIMKSMGAKSRLIAVLYLSLVSFYGIISIALSLLAASLGGNFAAQYLASLINFNLDGWYIPSKVILVITLLGIFIPCSAAFFPIFNALRIPIHEALSNRMISKRWFGKSNIERFSIFLTSNKYLLKRPIIFAIRNMFRSKMRFISSTIMLALTAISLMAIASIYTSINNTLSTVDAYSNYDLSLSFDQTVRTKKAEQIIHQINKDIQVNGWLYDWVRFINRDGISSDLITTIGIDPDSNLVEPRIIEGRWLTEDDDFALVINSEVILNHPDLKVGQSVNLKLYSGSQEQEWKIVGIAHSPLLGGTIYVNKQKLEMELGKVGQSQEIRLSIPSYNPASASALIQSLGQSFDSAGINVVQSYTQNDFKLNIANRFQLIINFLLIALGILIGSCSIGLLGLISLSLLEYQNELGLMRAMGASNRTTALIVIMEGIGFSIIGWLVAFPFSYLAGQWISNQVGLILINAPLIYRYSLLGSLICILSLIFLSIIGSFLPARHASKITLKEILANI